MEIKREGESFYIIEGEKEIPATYSKEHKTLTGEISNPFQSVKIDLNLLDDNHLKLIFFGESEEIR
ncbi:hypothetical protein [Limibacterium fermenti]|jgi:hypothetical protein|uniref:hypothetical protein n=1 Tax=Limibacterium fermenti TaxID=3229863 RepID=UPI003A6F3C82